MFQAAALLTAILFGQVDSLYVAGVNVIEARGLVPDGSPNISQNADVETFLPENFSTHYFLNLTKNFGRNLEGSCTFVAAEMLLSYYDTYWDDDVIDDSYIANTVTTGSDAGDFVGIESPGAKPDPIFRGTMDYHDYVKKYSRESLHLYLLTLGEQLFDYIPAYDEDYLYGFSDVDMITVLEYYLTDIRGFDKSDYFFTRVDSSGVDDIRGWIIDRVKKGIPVATSIDISRGPHEAIAYDYDEETDEIYFHMGWTHSNAVCNEHRSYSELQIKSAYTLTFNTDHNHSGNYQFVDENGDLRDYCICYSVVPWDLTIENYSLDQLPTYMWTALRGDWYESLTYRVAFLTTSGYEKLIFEGVSGFSLRLTGQQFEQVLDIAGSSYRVYISLERDGEDFLDDSYYYEDIRDPKEYGTLTQILPSDWGFEARYWFENEGVRYTSLEIGDQTVIAGRLRCGYIENRYVVLSARRENAGRAYLELTFARKIYSFMYSALWWSSSENPVTATLSVQLQPTVWTEYRDFMSMDLPEGGTNPYRELLYFPTGIRAFRFEVTAQATGDRNKGRLCIDDIAYSTDSARPEFFYADYQSTYIGR